ncbi:MAG TPA: asparagine--tRNA ligase [Candidatus Atribacteria bacterium]|nr:asparagine--tRNA ligase [Candidatus Atribacteria bacterium]
MKDVYIEDIENYVGEEIRLKGWLYNKRSSGKIHFLIIRDGTGFLQATVIKSEVLPEVFEISDKLTQESSIIVEGVVRKEPRAKGGYEITVSNIELIRLADDYPIKLKEHGVDFLLNNRHLWIRTPRQTAILRLRSKLINIIRNFFDERKFVLVDSPILTPASCEGTTTLFETDYFDEKAFLSQSGQLYNEASAMALGRVYCFGPTFRAEKSKTRRHLMEFWMVEPEMAFYTLYDMMDLAEEMIVYILKRILEEGEKELKELGRDTSILRKIDHPFPRITYDEAIKILKKKGFEINWGDDFGGDEETAISEEFDKPVFVHHYPAEMKAFYMKPDPENEKLSLSADLLAPEGYGEIIGGGERIDDYDLLYERMVKENLPIEDYKWYLDLRKYGGCPHSGYGLGIERTLAWIAKLPHVRETIPFPRLLYRIYP